MKKLMLFASAVAMLASCSKELTEDVAPVQGPGKATIYADYAGPKDDSATRTHAEGVVEGNQKGYRIGWDNGDAIGVFDVIEDATSKEIKADDSNVYFGYNAMANEFNGNYGFLAGKTFVGYYPYKGGNKLTDGKLTLNIPASQQYRVIGAAETEKFSDGTFATNIAPAVGYGTYRRRRQQTPHDV